MEQNTLIQQLQSDVEDLQTQLAFQEDTIQTLSDLIHTQQQQIDQLQEQDRQMLSQLQQLREGQGQQIPDERPPHY